ncbi:MAG: hypothetical protein IPN68_05475 [Bacteroidetes bacterium]|nr:hypothetical protein [Bacteroidota bacterium]
MKTSLKLLFWLPRIIVILAILFVSIFAFDSFSSERTVWQNAGAFLMHLIPSFILAGILIIAWKWEMVGGIILILVGLVFSVLLFITNFGRNHSVWISLSIVLMLCLPFVLAGVLFLISSQRKKKELAGI